MGKRVEVDELIDAYGIAQLLNFARRNDVWTYRSRHDDFPEPILDLNRGRESSTGRPILWLRRDIIKWAEKHPRREDPSLVRDIGNVKLVARSLARPGQPDSESDYMVTAREIDGHGHSAPILVPKPGGATAALDAAAKNQWVLDHR